MITIYDLATGRVKGNVSCSDDLRALQVSSGEGYVEGCYNDSYYIDAGAAVNIGVAPSEYHVLNWTTKQWEDLRTLQDMKDAQWGQIKQARAQAEYSGFTWDGSTFDSDATSQNRITGAVVLASASPSFSIDWILADNTTRPLSQADMLQVGAALGFHVAAQFSKCVLLRAAIDSATAQSEVDLVMW